MLPITDVKILTLKKNGSKLRGFQLCTPNQSTCVYALIENVRTCCEDYGFQITIDDGKTDQIKVCCENSSSVDHDDMELLRNTLVGNHIYSVNWGDKSEIKRTDPQTNTLTVSVQTISGLHINLILYNTHNGYYYHNTLVKWDGNEDDTNEL